MQVFAVIGLVAIPEGAGRVLVRVPAGTDNLEKETAKRNKCAVRNSGTGKPPGLDIQIGEVIFISLCLEEALDVGIEQQAIFEFRGYVILLGDLLPPCRKISGVDAEFNRFPDCRQKQRG